MNIQSKLLKSPTEEALAAYFSEMVGQFKGSSHVVQARDDSFSALLKNGLPTRRIEVWHYTDLRRLLNHVPAHQPNQFIKPYCTIGCWLMGCWYR